MWQNEVQAFRRNMDGSSRLAEGSRVRYAYEVERFFKLLKVESTASLEPRQILDWNNMLHEAGAARNTVGQKHAALRLFLQYREEFEDDEHAGRLLRALKFIKIPAVEEPRRAPFNLPESDFLAMLEAAAERPGVGQRDRALLHFIWASGCRRAEARNLILPNLDIVNRQAEVLGKGAKWRTVIFSDPCKDDLGLWLPVRATWGVNPEVQEVFVSAFGRPLNLNTVGTIVRETADRAGLQRSVWTHVFRHSRSTTVVNGGMSLADAGKLLGHSKPATTMKYLHPDASRLKDEYDKATGAG